MEASINIYYVYCHIYEIFKLGMGRFIPQHYFYLLQLSRLRKFNEQKNIINLQLIRNMYIFSGISRLITFQHIYVQTNIVANDKVQKNVVFYIHSTV